MLEAHYLSAKCSAWIRRGCSVWGHLGPAKTKVRAPSKDSELGAQTARARLVAFLRQVRKHQAFFGCEPPRLPCEAILTFGSRFWFAIARKEVSGLLVGKMLTFPGKGEAPHDKLSSHFYWPNLGSHQQFTYGSRIRPFFLFGSSAERLNPRSYSSAEGNPCARMSGSPALKLSAASFCARCSVAWHFPLAMCW